MRKFRKYEFGSKSAATTKIKALGVDEEGLPSHPHSIVVLGNIVTKKGVYDADDNEVTAPAFSSSWHVDVLWNGDPDPNWDNQMIWCLYPGVHSFGNSAAEEEFIKECKVQQPDLYPSEEE